MTGTVKLYKDGQLLFSKHNQIQDGSKVILCNLLAGNTNYKPDTLYIEFQNSSDTPEIPVYTTDAGVEYYSNLDSPKDYLKVPIVIKPSVEDNSVTFSAVVAAGTGEHGLVCGSTTQAYGAALVSESAGQVYARMYFDTPITLTTATQYYLPWTINF